MRNAVPVALAILLLPLAHAHAEEPKAAIAKIDALVRGLESNDAIVRAKAADDLGRAFPDGARGVPVLLDATTDDDARVRTASVTALRRLGRAGLEVACKSLVEMSPVGSKTIDEVGSWLTMVRPAVTSTDVASQFVDAARNGPEATRAALLAIAAQPPIGTQLLDPTDVLEILAPWVDARDARVALTGAAALAIVGRSLVAGEAWDETTQADVASPPGLWPLFAHHRLSTQWAAWNLVAYGAPHGSEVAAGVLARWQSKKWPLSEESADVKAAGVRFEPAYFSLEHFLPLVRSLGTNAKSSGVRVAESDSIPAPMRADVLWRIGDESAARELWAGASRTSTPDAGLVAAPWLDVLVETPALARGDVAGIWRWASRVPERRTPRGDTEVHHSRVDAAALVLASDEGDAGTRAAALDTLASVMKTGGFAAIGAARRIVRLGHRGAALATKIASLLPSSRLTREEDTNPREALRPAYVVEALAATGSVPGSAVHDLSLRLAPVATIEHDASTRLEHARNWSSVRPALDALRLGALAFVSQRARRAAVDALGQVVDNRDAARAALKPLANDADARVRYRVARALRRLGG